jgi:hypothetical protein
LGQEQERDIVDVPEGRQWSVAHHDNFERQEEPFAVGIEEM